MSLADYDEFGNYIGALSDSDEGSDAGGSVGGDMPPLEEPAPLEGYGDDEEMDEEGAPADSGMQLMQIDGEYRRSRGIDNATVKSTIRCELVC